MRRSFRIIIIGFGSIGQRHYRNLIRLGFKNVYIYDADKNKTKNQKLKIKNINPQVLEGFSVAFICAPNHLHIKYALMAAKAGCHLFIEKPLSHNFKDINKLARICEKKESIVLVGCNMRFHPCLRFIKNYLNKGRLGKIYNISHEFGYYLPFWRVGQDYTKNYAAKKSTGGGIILDDIHEFDLLFWLSSFFKPVKSKFFYGKISNLKIETEDFCLAYFRFKNNLIGTVKCDYLQKSYTRNCKIVGEKGNLEWDFKHNVVWLKDEKTAKKLFAIKKFNFNQTYLNEVKYFFSQIDKKQKTFNDIKTAFAVLKYCIKR